jgi:hypothetical protein
LEESTKEIKVAPLVFSELLHKKDPLQKERKSETKIPLLEFLEGSLCRMVNKVSTTVLYDFRRYYWIFISTDI